MTHPTQPGGAAQVRTLGCGLIPLLTALAALAALVGLAGVLAPGLWDEVTSIFSQEETDGPDPSEPGDGIPGSERDASVQAPTDGLTEQEADLVAACDAGGMAECDRLRDVAQWSTPAYDFGLGCGGWYPEEAGFCVTRQEEWEEVRELVGRCQADDMSACDAASWRAREGTEEWQVAHDCGGRFPGQGGSCGLAEVREKDDSPTP